MEKTYWTAVPYSENSNFQYIVSKKLLKSCHLTGAETILDIGCGHGLLTSELAELVPNGKVIGIDYSEDMICYATKNYAQPNLIFRQMNAEEINFPGEKFDVIISTFCIQWVPNKSKVFHAIARHLKENGQILLIMPFPQLKMAEIRQRLYDSDEWKTFFKDEKNSHNVTYDNKYNEYALQAGFLNLQYNIEEVSAQFESKEKFKAFIRNISPILSHLPDENLREKFLTQQIELYLADNPASKDGSCQISYITASIIARGTKEVVDVQSK